MSVSCIPFDPTEARAPLASWFRDAPLRSCVMGEAADTSEIDIDPGRVADWRTREPQLQLIDVREPYEREAGHIDGSRHIALGELSSLAPTVAREQPVVFYCRVGARSEMAAQAFRTAGYDAYSMSGGLVRWAREGLPLSPAEGRVADH
jgi:rhodanese-related sulfurtransferase